MEAHTVSFTSVVLRNFHTDILVFCLSCSLASGCWAQDSEVLGKHPTTELLLPPHLILPHGLLAFVSPASSLLRGQLLLRCNGPEDPGRCPFQLV